MKDIRLQTSQEYSRKIGKLIGIPYDTLDCWGVCTEFYKIHGHTIKKYYEKAPNNTEVSYGLIKEIVKDLIEVKTLEYGDFILIDLLGFPSHCGIYLGEGKMLHTNRNTGCIVDNMNRWDKRIVAYYRMAQ